MTIREIYAIGTHRTIQREAICDRCGWTTGRKSARSMPFAKAEGALRDHRKNCIKPQQERARP